MKQKCECKCGLRQQFVKKKCECGCAKKASYNEQYDVYYCSKCIKWIEQDCKDRSCQFCSKRPEFPPEHYLNELTKEAQNMGFYDDLGEKNS